MDSMTSLNTSLPSTHPSRSAPAEQLLAAFKSAALSVTHLYKSAVTDQSSSRAAGYQDALDDMLRFLDSENLGLQDGEGWQMRQWVTERYDGTANQAQADSDGERSEIGQHNQAESPPVVEEPREAPEPEPQVDASMKEATAEAISTDAEPQSVFKFTAGESSPRIEEVPSSSPSHHEPSSPPPIKVEIVNRIQRTPHRRGGQRHNTRTQIRELTSTAGTKRKMQFPEFFDISNFGPGEGSGGGNKRTRMA